NPSPIIPRALSVNIVGFPSNCLSAANSGHFNSLVLPISNRPRVTSSCAGKIGLREPGEHTSGPNLASRDNVAHIQNLYTILKTPPRVSALSKAGPDIRYQMVACWWACIECWRSLAAVERVPRAVKSNRGGTTWGGQKIEAAGPAVFRLDCKMGLEAEPV